MKGNKSSAATLALGFLVMTLVGQCYSQLITGYYTDRCGSVIVEDFIRAKVVTAFESDRTLAAAMLRMLFHDCFVRGCDASLLLDGENTEKTAGPNRSVRGYELIDDIKRGLEDACPQVVSCADIIVIVTKVTVEMASDHKIVYNVETGRRDGVVSQASDTRGNLPPPNVAVSDAISIFLGKGLTPEDFVLLMGGHTVGISQCVNFQSRLYNFNGKNGTSDPDIDPNFLQVLKQTCPQDGVNSNKVDLDQITPHKVDNSYYNAILKGFGVLQIDNDIAYDKATRKIVANFASNVKYFNDKFGVALNNLARVGVLTGTNGEIRTTCRMINKS